MRNQVLLLLALAVVFSSCAPQFHTRNQRTGIAHGKLTLINKKGAADKELRKINRKSGLAEELYEHGLVIPQSTNIEKYELQFQPDPDEAVITEYRGTINDEGRRIDPGSDGARSAKYKPDGFAVASFGTALVGSFIWAYPLGLLAAVLAIVFSLIGLSRINKSDGKRSGKGFAVTGLVLGLLIMAAYGIIYFELISVMG